MTMAGISIEEARIRVAIGNPRLTSADVRREADRVLAVLDSIEFEDRARAEFAAQAAEQEREQAVAAQRRQEAYSDARGVVAKSHPGWDDASMDMEAHRLAAENESAIAAMNLRDALAEG